eukprot:CAMPEP_0172180518 /NCGR_PEP_ID=MMETSP1050-20130122/17275_1 /TAXON_ID=233186 /ORGANISM="Cryptomonas curvata, Strain CCAP979/52" /LENGTH=242 /DNA_ID=CAMNT_0012853635 /DNA_START=62 /DNA_END=787 /DNA_ORIENTATION=+
MRIPSRDNAPRSSGDGDQESDWNHGPSVEPNPHPTEYIGIHDPSVLAQLLANRNRADLHLTSCAALIFLLFAVMLFSLDNSENSLSYDNAMQGAVCTVIDQQLQQIEDPDIDMPPDIDLPVPLKWRAEERVHVKPEMKGIAPFDAVVFNTALGAYSRDRETQIQWLELHPAGDSRPCLFGDVEGRTAVVFDQSDDLVSPALDGRQRWGLPAARLGFGTLALLFLGLALHKLLRPRPAPAPAG